MPNIALKDVQQNSPGSFKIEAPEAPGSLPGGPLGGSRAPPKQGIKMDPVPEPIPSISAPRFFAILCRNGPPNGGHFFRKFVIEWHGSVLKRLPTVKS